MYFGEVDFPPQLIEEHQFSTKHIWDIISFTPPKNRNLLPSVHYEWPYANANIPILPNGSKQSSYYLKHDWSKYFHKQLNKIRLYFISKYKYNNWIVHYEALGYIPTFSGKKL